MNRPAPQLEAGTEETILIVPAMHCAGCMAKVERALSELSGVSTARVNLTARQVRVTHAPELQAPALMGALSAIGASRGFPRRLIGAFARTPPWPAFSLWALASATGS